MATNTLIQKLFGSDETGVGEDSNAVSNRVVTEKFLTSEAISAGACVSLDVSQASNGQRAMIVAEADGSDYVPVGIYAGSADAASGEYIDVILRGIVEEALVDGSGTAVVAGDRLCIGSDGKLQKVTQFRTDAGDGTGTTTGTFGQPEHVVAISLEGISSDGSARVYVLKNF
jgi:hypothetical protein